MSLTRLAILVIVLTAAIGYCTTSFLKADVSLRAQKQPVGGPAECCNTEEGACVVIDGTCPVVESSAACDPVAGPNSGSASLRNSLAQRRRDSYWRTAAGLSIRAGSVEARDS